MWERFTTSARAATYAACDEARRLGENYISTEHLLLGLMAGSNSATRILERFGLIPDQVRLLLPMQGPHGKVPEEMTLAPRGKRVYDLAYHEARGLNNDFIGTEHILLGLIREGAGLGGQVLASLGLELEETRRVVAELQAA
jgi:ATP-dependent Clp protease ATP-binding subunit ClpC